MKQVIVPPGILFAMPNYDKGGKKKNPSALLNVGKGWDCYLKAMAAAVA